MNEFFYKLGDVRWLSKEKCSSETPKMTKIGDESQAFDEDDKLLNKIEYQPLILDVDKASKLRDSWEEVIDMQMRYGVVIDILKTNPIDWNKEIIQLPNLCLTKIDRDRFKFDKNTHLITIINRTNIVDEYLNFIEKGDLLYLNGLKGIGKSFIIYQMVAKLMAMDGKYRVIYINQSNRFLITYVFAKLKAIALYDSRNEEFKRKFETFLTLTTENLNDIVFPHI
jgi:hypothetical protein